MNPIFVICILLAAFLIWIGSALFFPLIGKAIMIWLECFKYITKEDNEEDEDER